MTSRETGQFYLGMSEVKKIRRIKGAPELNIRKFVNPEEKILEALYKAT